MRKSYNFSNGVKGKYYRSITKKNPSWILEPEKCQFCGKLSYETLDDAEYAAKQQSKKTQIYEPYKCNYKEVWHLTSK